MHTFVYNAAVQHVSYQLMIGLQYVMSTDPGGQIEELKPSEAKLSQKFYKKSFYNLLTVGRVVFLINSFP